MSGTPASSKDIEDLKQLIIESIGRVRADVAGCKAELTGVNRRLDKVNGRLDRHDDQITDARVKVAALDARTLQTAAPPTDLGDLTRLVLDTAAARGLLPTTSPDDRQPALTRRDAKLVWSLATGAGLVVAAAWWLFQNFQVVAK